MQFFIIYIFLLSKKDDNLDVDGNDCDRDNGNDCDRDNGNDCDSDNGNDCDRDHILDEFDCVNPSNRLKYGKI
jgi:hypothetical protein